MTIKCADARLHFFHCFSLSLSPYPWFDVAHLFFMRHVIQVNASCRCILTYLGTHTADLTQDDFLCNTLLLYFREFAYRLIAKCIAKRISRNISVIDFIVESERPAHMQVDHATDHALRKVVGEAPATTKSIGGLQTNRMTDTSSCYAGNCRCSDGFPAERCVLYTSKLVARITRCRVTQRRGGDLACIGLAT